MEYVVLKSLHLTALMAWIASMLAAAVAISAGELRFSGKVLQWQRRVSNLAMLLTWTAGAGLAVQVGFFGASWLWIKLALVTIVAGVHGVLAGIMQQGGRLEELPDAKRRSRVSLAILAILLPIIVVLVVGKPSF